MYDWIIGGDGDTATSVMNQRGPVMRYGFYPHRCVFKLPEKPRKPNYAALSNFLGEKALQSTQERLSQAVLAGEIRNKEKSHDTIKFGFLVEMMSPSSLGAVSLAVDSVNADEELLPNVKLEFSFERIHSKWNISVHVRS